MSVELDEQVDGAEHEPAEGSDQDGFVCPDCDYVAPSRLTLGGHRFQKHGVRGKTADRKRKSSGRPRGRPPGGGRASGDTGGGESSRQTRRRRAVKETLVELVSFTDEARGRGEGAPQDLADVIRRDADKIANSVAWIAERFNPLGRMIDLAFGHGGLLTVARGFMGVGTWTLAHWRQMLEQRQVEMVELSAEQIAEQMQHEYGPQVGDERGYLG